MAAGDRAAGFGPTWEAADQALVLPGERLCVFRAEMGPDTLTAVAPVPGRLFIALPSGRFLSPETIVGELQYGSAFEAEIRRQVSVPAVDRAALTAERERLAAETAALERELAALRTPAGIPPPEPGSGRSDAAAPGAAAAALRELLERLLPALKALTTAERQAVGIRDQLSLLALIPPLRKALVAAGLRPPPRPQLPDQATARAMAAVARLYDEQIRRAEGRSRRTFPFPSGGKK